MKTLFLSSILSSVPPPNTTPDIAPLISDPAVVDAAKAAYEGFTQRNWGIVAFGLIIILTSGLRLFGKRISPKLGAFFNHPMVRWALPGVIGTLAGAMGAMLAGKPMLDALVVGFTTGAVAAYSHKGYKSVLEARALGAATAEARVLDKAAALSILKGPNP